MKRKMAVVQKASEVVFEEFEIPELADDDILLKTCYSAICGSDLHLYYDVHPFVKAPCSIGHELCGRVAAYGRAVTKVSAGDLIAPEPILVCGKCGYCESGSYHMCDSVSYQYRCGQGGFSDYFIVKERWAHKVPESLGEKAAAIIEPLSVAMHGTGKAGKIFGKSVLVIGAGAIGAMTAHICKAAGASCVFIADINDRRLKIAEKISGAAGLNTNAKDCGTLFRKASGNMGFDIIFECTGLEACAADAVNAVKKLGVIVQMGIGRDNFKNFPFMKILQKEITLRGSQGYCFDFERSIAQLSAGNIDILPYVTHIFPSKRLKEAFALASAKDTDSMKILISYSEGETK